MPKSKLKRVSVVGGGVPCPKCGVRMQRRCHAAGFTPPRTGYWFEFWDVCRRCRHVQHYEPAKRYGGEKREITVTAVEPTQRECERARYLEANALTYGIEGATKRWLAYEQLIREKYGGDDLEAAWRARDRAHQRRSQSAFWGVFRHYKRVTPSGGLCHSAPILVWSGAIS
jgi:hypothetical protein